jgi:hypothetical protein
MPVSLTVVMTFALVLGLVGCVSGFLAGLLGVGGGIVVVPVLYHVLAFFDVDPALRHKSPSARRSLRSSPRPSSRSARTAPAAPSIPTS